MPFWRSYAHLVWATTERKPLIAATIEKHLYAQIVKKAAALECYIYAVNGMSDHIHLVLSIPPKHSVSYVVKELKGASARFVNHILRPPEYHFAWQRGYGYLTLGHTQLDRAVTYVEGQKAHHASDTTNNWLERNSELDEGPDDGVRLAEEGGVLREERVVYHALGEPPF